MQYRLALLALVAAVSAQDLTQIPTCATSCITSGLPSNCNLDPKCICTSTSFLNAISCCISTACNQADQQATLDYAHTVCDPVGAGAGLPKSATCAAGASGSSASGSSTASGSTTGSTTGAAASASSATGSVAQSATSVVSSLSSSASAAASSASAAGSSAASTAAAAATSGAANSLIVPGAGAVGAGLLGIAAML